MLRDDLNGQDVGESERDVQEGGDICKNNTKKDIVEKL